MFCCCSSLLSITPLHCRALLLLLLTTMCFCCFPHYHALLLFLIIMCCYCSPHHHVMLLLFLIHMHYYCFSLPCVVVVVPFITMRYTTTTPCYHVLLMFLSSWCIATNIPHQHALILFLITMHCYCSPCQCVLLLFLVIMHYCSFCQCVLRCVWQPMFLVIMCYYYSLSPCWCALLPLPKYLFDLLLLPSSLLLCATIVPFVVLVVWLLQFGTNPTPRPTPPHLCLCANEREETRNFKLKFLQCEHFFPLFVFLYYFVCIIVCVLWICIYLDFFCCICFVC